MTGISRVDQAVLQLRAQLQRLARERTHRSRITARSPSGPLERLHELGAAKPSGDEGFRKKFVRALLTEELGEALSNQPEFERISNEVWRLLDEDPETKTLMEEAIGRLGSAGG